MELIHTHTHFSVGDGMMTSEKLVKIAKEKGFNAIGLSDHGNIGAFFTFLQSCKTHKVKPILGCEVYFNAELEKSKAGQDRTNQHICIYAKNLQGYRNLVRMTSRAWMEGFYYRPRLDEKILSEEAGDMIVSTACMAGVMRPGLENGNLVEAKKQLDMLRGIFGSENVFVEIQLSEIEENKFLMEGLCNLKKTYPDDIQFVLGQDTHYANVEDRFTHEVMLNIQGSRQFGDSDWRKYPTQLGFIRTEAEQREIWALLGYNKFMSKEILDEAIQNTYTMANMVDVYEIAQDPVFVDVTKFGFNETLTDLIKAGFVKRGITDRKYLERIKYELDVVKKTGIGPYLLATHAVVDIAKENNVLVGPGRGSAAGSLINYLIGTTNVDPIEHDLLFERFINPDRVEIPDIDVDYSHPGRVYDKVVEHFGEERICKLSTYSFYQYKGLIRDLARVFKYDIGETNSICKSVDSIDAQDKYSIDELAHKTKPFGQWIKNHAGDNIQKHLSELHGLIRHKGVHAAGMLMADDEIWNHFPVERHSNVIVSTFTEGQKQRDLNDLGGVKFDVLGLNTLRIQQDCIRNIAKRQGKSMDDVIDMVDFSKMDHEVKGVYSEIFAKGNTDDIFQFESPVARRILNDIQPDCFDDIVAINALNRPGPLQGNYDSIYAERKHSGKVEKVHPIVDRILEPTYGTLVYQEQVVLLCKELGELTNSEAEMVRKGIFKLRSTHIKKDAAKQKEMLDQIETKLFTNAQKNGMSKAEIKKLWTNIMKFVGYAFNKAHSVSYAAVAYVSAWLKYHYPVEWYCAYLNGISGDATKVKAYIRHLEAKNISVEPPHVRSTTDASSTVINDKTIRLGINVLKNVGANLPDFVSRHKNNIFDFVNFFILSINDKHTNINKRVIESLIKVGFFDDFPAFQRIDSKAGPGDEVFLQRSQLMYFFGQLNQSRFKFKFVGSVHDVSGVLMVHHQFIHDLIDDAEKQPIKDFSKYKAEMEIMNFSLQDHPFKPYQDYAKDVRENIKTEQLAVLGEIVEVRERTTKRGAPYAMVLVNDIESEKTFKLMYWNNLIMRYNPVVGEGGLYIIEKPHPKFGTCQVFNYTNIPM